MIDALDIPRISMVTYKILMSNGQLDMAYFSFCLVLSSTLNRTKKSLNNPIFKISKCSNKLNCLSVLYIIPEIKKKQPEQPLVLLYVNGSFKKSSAVKKASFKALIKHLFVVLVHIPILRVPIILILL